MGYIGQKMSERAQAAYNSGEMPHSKWTKAAILSELEDRGLTAEDFKKYSADTLRDYFFMAPHREVLQRDRLLRSRRARSNRF